MGEFISPGDMKGMALVPLIEQLEEEKLDALFIIPAEELIARECVLQLNTDKEPWRWVGRFDNDANERSNFRANYRMAVIRQVNRDAGNPSGFSNQTQRSASVTHGSRIDPMVRTLMQRWSNPRRVSR